MCQKILAAGKMSVYTKPSGTVPKIVAACKMSVQKKNKR